MYHFKDSNKLEASVFIRADNFAETVVVNERGLTELLSLIGGLATAVLSPIGIVVRTFAAFHFKALMIKSVYTFNKNEEEKILADN